MPSRAVIALLSGLALASGCGPATQPEAPSPPTERAKAPNMRPPAVPDSPALNSVRDGRLGAVRQLVARLNARPRRAWSLVRSMVLHESTEGGEAVFYYQHHELQKITTHYLGETGQQRTAYYLLAGQLAFVQERTYAYNRPITYDSAAMRANADTAAFDFAKSTITTTRSYFDHGQLLYRVESPATDSVAAAAYRQRRQRQLAAELRGLLALPAGRL